MSDQDPEDIDSVDPEDVEVEIEDEDANDEFTPEGTEKAAEEAEEVSTDEETLEVGAEPEDEVPASEGVEPSEADLVEDAGELGKYLITGLVDYTDEQGNIKGQLEKDSIQEVPVALGDSWVEAGQAEKVQ